jgi:hypothetical protein
MNMPPKYSGQSGAIISSTTSRLPRWTILRRTGA